MDGKVCQEGPSGKSSSRKRQIGMRKVFFKPLLPLFVLLGQRDTGNQAVDLLLEDKRTEGLSQNL
jgi:hypothetical protein